MWKEHEGSGRVSGGGDHLPTHCLFPKQVSQDPSSYLCGKGVTHSRLSASAVLDSKNKLSFGFSGSWEGAIVFFKMRSHILGHSFIIS